MTTSAQRRDAVRAEELRLVLEGVAQSVVIGFLVVTLMLVVLWPIASHTVLIVWYTAFLVERGTTATYAHRALRRPRDPERDRRIERVLLVAKGCEGTILGSLLWIGLPAQVPSVSILLMSLMGALCGNGVSLLAPRRHLYLALVVPLVTVAAVTLFALGGIAYRALGICSVLYVIGQYGQVRLASRRVRESIELRFENSDLVDQLRAETDTARLARREAEDANAAKSHFLAAASHDLRQPIHALGLFLQALRQTRLDAAQQRMVESAHVAGLASADMLNTLLDFSRLDAGVVTPRPVAFPLQPLLDKLEREIAPLADDKRLIYRTAQVDLSVCSDPGLLELILRNLLLNAIRYTRSGGVLVGCRRRGGDVSIEIYDTGIGIPADQHQAVFREFHQLGNPERDRQKGLGLGLAIVKGLAAALDHPLTLSSREGRGSVFRLRVPLADAAAMLAEPPAMADRADALAGKKVLIVDDDPVVRDAMLHLVASWNGRGFAAEGWQEATSDAASERRPDVIVCDYRLRDNETGARTIERLRRFWQAPIPALLVTGDTAPERLREAAESGMSLMHKPVAAEDLFAHLAALVQTGGNTTERSEHAASPFRE